MDFEIEESGEDQDYYDDPYQNRGAKHSYGYGSTAVSTNSAVRRSAGSGFFSAGNDEDGGDYDFEYDQAPTGRIPAFSPAAAANRNNRKNFGDVSSDYESSHDSYPVQQNDRSKAQGGNSNPALRLSVASQESALEKAQSMLSRYSQKGKPSNTYSEPTTNFKTKKASHFDEDDLSMEEELDGEEEEEEEGYMDISDSVDKSREKLGSTKSLSSGLKKSPAMASLLPTKQPAPKIAATNFNKMIDDSNMSHIIHEESVHEYEDEEDVIEEEDVDDVAIDENEDDYGDEEFDRNEEDDELGESIAHDDEESLPKPVNKSLTKNEVKGTTMTKQSVNSMKGEKYEQDDTDDDEANENASYSRMVYGQEEDVESVEVDDDYTEASKPKIFSFTDLGEIAGWEPTASNNNVFNDMSHGSKQEQPAERKPIPKTESTAQSDPVVGRKSKAVDGRTGKVTIPSGANPSTVSSTSVNPSSQRSTPLVPHSITTSESSYPPNIPQGPPAPSLSNDPHQHAPPPTTSSSYPHHGYPYHPYPPSPFQVPPMVPPNGAQSGSYPTYPYSPPFPPYCYPPYGYFPPAVPPCNYPPYSCPLPIYGYGLQSPESLYSGFPSHQPPEVGKPTVLPSAINSQSLSTVGNQPIVLELLKELSKVQEEANWARTKLAETLMLLKETGQSPAVGKIQTVGLQNQSNIPPSTAREISQPAAKHRYGRSDEVELEGEEYSQDYSEDFDVSQLNLSASYRGSRRNSPKKNVVAKSAVDEDKESSGVPVHRKQQCPPPMPKLAEEDSDCNDGKKFDQFGENTLPRYMPNRIDRLGNLPLRFSGSLATTNEFLDPFADSVAKSFMASQELLRTKLDALRLKIQMTNQMSAEREALEEFSMGRDTVNREDDHRASSLGKLRMQFDTKRKKSEDRLKKLLQECYPDLDEEEILNMAKLVD